MEILQHRDLIKDELGNYYVVSAIDDNQLTLVNAVVYYSFNYILNKEFVKEVTSNYESSVGVGQFFTDLVKNKIEGLQTGKYPGGIYSLGDVLKEYQVQVESLYERNVNLEVK
ncbi:hypothetical protein M3685_11000 [Heyndrickxia oleronia]|uniref:hypothetical protein n=1 Tax=Heyndrickxia oleronia TaxID=38875 RepID=UPI0020402112|nr:hypothetical protein [Heyndrickxia oleronia]MCM3454472.1 hypothetical protein [Heyndrickxia oleronia]